MDREDPTDKGARKQDRTALELVLLRPPPRSNRDAWLRWWAAWVVRQCLAHGTRVSTAYSVAAIFVEGLERHS